MPPAHVKHGCLSLHAAPSQLVRHRCCDCGGSGDALVRLLWKQQQREHAQRAANADAQTPAGGDDNCTAARMSDGSSTAPLFSRTHLACAACAAARQTWLGAGPCGRRCAVEHMRRVSGVRQRDSDAHASACVPRSSPICRCQARQTPCCHTLPQPWWRGPAQRRRLPLLRRRRGSDQRPTRGKVREPNAWQARCARLLRAIMELSQKPKPRKGTALTAATLKSDELLGGATAAAFSSMTRTNCVLFAAARRNSSLHACGEVRSDCCRRGCAHARTRLSMCPSALRSARKNRATCAASGEPATRTSCCSSAACRACASALPYSPCYAAAAFDLFAQASHAVAQRTHQQHLPLLRRQRGDQRLGCAVRRALQVARKRGGGLCRALGRGAAHNSLRA